jgi:DNA primase
MAGGSTAAQRYHHQLVRERDNEAWLYLKHRGLRPFWIKQFELGWVQEPSRGHERYRNRISIPYRTGFGDPREMRFRALNGGFPKYLGATGEATHMFAPKYTAEKLVYVTEGEFNCIILHQIGAANAKKNRGAVGIPGANHFKREWRWMFRHAEHVVGVLDGQGEPGAASLFRTKLSTGLKDIVPVTFVQMPDGHDINSMYLRDRRKLARLLEVT